MKYHFPVPIAIVLCLACWTSVAAGSPNETVLRTTLDRKAWPPQRDGRTILALTPIRILLGRFDEVQPHRVIIRYPGGDLGNAWGLELRDWLVALGVPLERLVLEPGSGASDQVVLILQKAGD